METKLEKIYEYSVIFEPAEEGGYVVRVPALPGCHTEGDTLKEAKKMAKEAITLHLETLRAHNLPIPTDDKSRAITFTDQIAVALG